MTVKQFTVDNTTWTPIVAPVPCNAVTLIDSAAPPVADLKVRSTPTDSATEKTYAAAVGVSLNAATIGTFRSVYQTGQVLFYVQASAGAPTLVGTFL